MPKPFKSLQSIIGKIARISKENKECTLFFRGHSKKSYTLQPTILRKPSFRQNEHYMFKQIMAAHPLEFLNDTSTFDKLVRCQHYGIPTRLLDVSKNPLVGAYFATCSNPSQNGQIIVIKPSIKNELYFDSDTVLLLSSLALVDNHHRMKITDCFITVVKSTFKRNGVSWKKENKTADKIKELFDKDTEEVIDEFNAYSSIIKFSNLIRKEHPAFEPRIKPLDIVYVRAVLPKKLHPRIAAQNGAFLLFGLSKIATVKTMPGIEVEHINIDATAKVSIQNELAQLGISTETLFPEIENTALQIKKRYE